MARTKSISEMSLSAGLALTAIGIVALAIVAISGGGQSDITYAIVNIGSATAILGITLMMAAVFCHK